VRRVGPARKVLPAQRPCVCITNPPLCSTRMAECYCCGAKFSRLRPCSSSPTWVMRPPEPRVHCYCRDNRRSAFTAGADRNMKSRWPSRLQGCLSSPAPGKASVTSARRPMPDLPSPGRSEATLFVKTMTRKTTRPPISSVLPPPIPSSPYRHHLLRLQLAARAQDLAAAIVVATILGAGVEGLPWIWQACRSWAVSPSGSSARVDLREAAPEKVRETRSASAQLDQVPVAQRGASVRVISRLGVGFSPASRGPAR
jgi:hypothetical protein